MLHRSIRALAVGLACALIMGVAQAQDPLPAAVLDALRSAGLPEDSLAAVALPLRHRGRPWQHQGERPMQPGSSMKLVTSIVALDRLGPNHRGTTELRSAAPLQNGKLRGDLVLKGGGDVGLGVPQLWALLVDLQQAGVRHIAGDLVVDRTRYQPARIDIGLPPFDEEPEFPYNVIPDALMLAQGLLPLELRATGSGVVASTVPRIDGIEFDSRMTLVDARCADWDEHWKPAQVTREDSRPGRLSRQGSRQSGRESSKIRITLNGAFPRGCTERTQLQLIDRAELTERLFRSLWRGLGGTWAGRAREEREAANPAASPAAGPAATRVLARHTSRPWGELLRHLNKTSDNAWTRLLYLELGVPAMAAQPERSTLELSEAAVRQWFAEQGISDTGLVLDNGSGLSRSERISPKQMAQMLSVAYFSQHASELLMSLPTAGVDGTLRNRLKAGPATGWARLKTGTLRNVAALAGYVTDPQGRPWAVAMMINHDLLASKGRAVLDALVDHIARHGPHPVAAFGGVIGGGP